MVICLLICLAVLLPKGGLGGSEAEDLNDADTPDLKTVMSEGTPVLIFDKRTEAQALVAAYENGTMEQVQLSWNDGIDVTVDTPSEVKEVYRLFKNIVVTAGDEDAGAAEDDSEGSDAAPVQIGLAFSVEDENPCEYTLTGESTLSIDDANYNITGAEPLIKYLNTLK